jgi:hypothetical protein
MFLGGDFYPSRRAVEPWSRCPRTTVGRLVPSAENHGSESNLPPYEPVVVDLEQLRSANNKRLDSAAVMDESTVGRPSTF